MSIFSFFGECGQLGMNSIAQDRNMKGDTSIFLKDSELGNLTGEANFENPMRALAIAIELQPLFSLAFNLHQVPSRGDAFCELLLCVAMWDKQGLDTACQYVFAFG